MTEFNLTKNFLTEAENYVTGTNEDDIYYIHHDFHDSNPIIINPSSKAPKCPIIGSCPQNNRRWDQFQNDGKDTYYLASDIDTRNRTFIDYNYPHDGGHRAYIMDFDATRVK